MNETATLTNKDKFLSHFDLVDFSMDEDFSSDVRKEAMELIQWLDFPTSKAEYWKYTRVNKIIIISSFINSEPRSLKVFSFY